MYATRKGVPQDYSEAITWYRQAAEQGHVNAQYNLGVMYAEGRGVPQDDAEADAWYRLAAQQGHVAAKDELAAAHLADLRASAEGGKALEQTILGLMYAFGSLKDSDAAGTEAVAWLHKAAEQGRADAQIGLAEMYALGRGVPQDDAEAVAWYRLNLADRWRDRSQQ